MLNAWRLLLVLGAAFVVWRSVAVGLSGHFAERLNHADGEAAQKALAWAPNQPEAAVAAAMVDLSGNPSAVRERLQRIYWQDPSSPRPLLVLADLARRAGDDGRADALVEQATRLSPANPGVLLQAARYWAEQGQLERALGYWSDALTADPGLRNEIFPVLLSLVEDPRTRAVFRPLADAPPSWWDGFFAEVARRALEVETLRALYGLRRASGVPLSPDERRAYVERLQREGRITEAYLVWVNGLAPEERRHLGLLFDGGFELEPSQAGFGWRAPRTRRVELRQGATFGIEGSQALHLRFARREGQFRHLYQRLYLDPGNYRISGKVRPDGLETFGGLRWRVSCLLPERQDLGESERFLGASDWRRFAFEVAVPEDCRYQEIRLVSSGRRSFEHRLAGEIWLDGMAIRKIAELGLAAQARTLEEGEPSGLETSSAGAEVPVDQATGTPQGEVAEIDGNASASEFEERHSATDAEERDSGREVSSGGASMTAPTPAGSTDDTGGLPARGAAE